MATAQPQPQPPGPAEERHKSNFVAESWAELKKVEWPTQNQLIQGVAVVLIACLIVGVFLYGCDILFKHLVQRVFT